MEHPYEYLIRRLRKYSKKLKPDDIKQYAENAFLISDPKFKVLKFLNDYSAHSKLEPLEHQYIGASCADPEMCLKPFTIYGFDNVLFYFENLK